MKWTLRIAAMVLLGTSQAWGSDGLPKCTAPFVTEDTALLFKLDLTDWNLDTLVDEALAQFWEQAPQLFTQDNPAGQPLLALESAVGTISENVATLHAAGIDSVILLVEFEWEAQTPTLVALFPCEKPTEDVLELVCENVAAFLPPEFNDDVLRAGLTEDAVCWILAKPDRDATFTSLRRTFQPAERPDLAEGLERVGECRLCAVATLPPFPDIPQGEDVPAAATEALQAIDADCRWAAAGIHLGDTWQDLNLLAYLRFTDADAAEKVLRLQKMFPQLMTREAPNEAMAPIIADFVGIWAQVCAFERDGTLLKLDVQANAQRTAEKYFGWIGEYRAYCAKNLAERANFDRKAEAERLAECVRPWVTHMTVAVAHLDLERFNLGDMSEAALSRLEQLFPNTFTTPGPVLDVVMTWENFVTCFEMKRAHILEAGGKDVFLVMDLVSDAVFVIPLATDNPRKLARVKNMRGLFAWMPEDGESVLENILVGVDSGAVVVFTQGPGYSLDADEQFRTRCELIHNNAADRPQFRKGFELGASECFQLVTLPFPALQPTLGPALELFEENGFTNPGPRVVTRGLDVVTLALDPHTGLVTLQAFSKSEAAATNLVRLSNIWKREFHEIALKDAPDPVAATQFQRILDMIQFDQGGRRVWVELQLPIQDEQSIEAQRTMAVSATVGVATALLLPAVQQSREAARQMQSANNMKQVALAMMFHESAKVCFPPAYTVDEEGKPLHSWRVALLPYLEQAALYKQIRHDEPWDSEWNSQFHDQCPKVYQDARMQCGPSEAVLAVVVGEGTVFDPKNPKGTRIHEIRDGTANTVLLVERTPVCWMDPAGDVKLEELEDGISDSPVLIFNGQWRAATCDGSVHLFPVDIRPEWLKNYFIRNDLQPLKLWEQ